MSSDLDVLDIFAATAEAFAQPKWKLFNSVC